MTLINAYTVQPDDIKPGDEMLFVVKAMVGPKDSDGKLSYRLYRCDWKGTEDDIPQGARIYDNNAAICQELFRSLAMVGKPDCQ